jgi:hypothetical protein
MFNLFHGLDFCQVIQQGACQTEALLQNMVYVFVIIGFKADSRKEV